MSHRHPRLRGLAGALGCTLVLTAPANAATDTIRVNSQSDASTCDATTCTLRGALAQANASGNGNDIVITVPAGDYQVATPLPIDPTAAPSISVQGAGAGATVLDGGTSDGRRTTVFDVLGGKASLNGLTITDGYPTGFSGGGVYAENATLELRRVHVTGNRVEAAEAGGGVFATNTTLAVRQSTIEGNTAGTAGGGGIATVGKPFEITNSTITGNAAPTKAGGLGAGSAGTVANSTIKANTAPAASGIGADGAQVTVERTIVDQGATGCAVANGGSIVDGAGGNNVDAGSACGFAAVNGSRNGLDPQLQAIAVTAFGGTRAYAPAPGSPVIDAAPASGCLKGNDQRPGDERRPLDGNGDGVAACDIGSVEYASAARDNLRFRFGQTTLALTSDVTNGDAPNSLFVEIGTTTAYGTTTQPVAVPAGSGVQSVEQAVAGLTPGTTYHFRVVGTDGVSRFPGPDRTVTTSPAPPVTPPSTPVGDPQPTPLTAKLAKVGKLALKTVAKRGYAVKVTCSAACGIRADLTVSKKVAKKLRLKSTRLGRATGTGTAGKATTVKVKVSKKIVRKLRARKVRKLSLTVVTTPKAGGKAVTTTRTVKVK